MTPRLGDVATDLAEPLEPVSPSGEVRRRRYGDAGRRAATDRADRYVAGIVPLLKTIMHEHGNTARAVASELTRRAVPKPRGGVVWTSADAQRLLRRISGGECSRPAPR